MPTKLDARAIANTIRMRSANSGRAASLIVEGESDERLYSFLLRDDVQLSFARGKQDAIDALRDLQRSSFRGLLALADLDHDALLGVVQNDRNLIYTSEHDLEMMLIRGGVLPRLSYEYLSPEFRDTTFEAALFDCAVPFGLVKLAARRLRVRLTVDSSVIQRCVNATTLTCDEDYLVRWAAKQDRSRRGEDEWRELIEAERVAGHDRWSLVKGHHIAEVLAQRLGASGRHVPRVEIERSMRLAYSQQQFIETELFAKLHAWECANPPFRILRDLG